MQKKIIALAVAAAFSAPAFADVSTYGIVDAAIISHSGSGQKSDMIAYSGGLSTSRLGMTATEGLDNGWTVIGALEYGFDAQTVEASSDTTNNFYARKKMLAVAGDFGTVATGYLQTTGYDLQVKFDPTSGSAVSPLQNMTKGGGFWTGSAAVASRAQRAVAYISPKFADSVTVAVNYSTSLAGAGNVTATADVKTTAFLASANYEKGPLAVGGVYTSVTAAGNSAGTEIAFGASYDLGMAKVFGTYQTNTPNGGSASKAYSFGAVAPVGAGAVVASFAGTKMATASTNGTGLTLGYLQNLSKTVTAYAAYSSVSQDSGTSSYSVVNSGLTANLTAGGSSSLVAVGLRKKF